MKLLSRMLILVLALASGAAAAADVGRVVLAAGDATALRQGQVVKLALGTPVQDKDVLRTGTASNLQVRFVDDSYVSLRESSELRVDQFTFTEGKGGESAAFSLLKGGLRAVTGLIGRQNHDDYKLVTPTATIGIRGTDYAATVCQGDCKNQDGSPARDGTYGRVIGQSRGTNKIEVSNDADRRTLGINSNFFVGDRKSPVELLLVAPEFVLSKLEGRNRGGSKGASGGTGTEQASTGGASEESRPSTIPPPLPQLQFVATQSLSPQGTPTVVQPQVVPNGFGVAVPGAGLLSGYAIFDDSVLVGTYNAQGQLLSFSEGAVTASLAGGSIADAGSFTMSNGQVITWGRWTGATSVPLISNTSGFVTTANVPLLFLTATDVAKQNSIIGSLGGVATYTYQGGPRPVDFAGNVGTMNSTSMTINFTTLQQSLALNMSFPSVLASGTNYGSAAFNLSGSGIPGLCNGNFCSGDFVGALTGSCTGGGCASASPSGYFQTGLTGPKGYEGAAVIGLVEGGTGTKGGDVAFLNLYLASSYTPGPLPLIQTGQLAYAYPYPSYSAGGVFSLPTNSTVYSGANPVAFNAGSSFGNLGSGTIVETGSIGLVDGGTMNWGRWSGATSITDPIIGTYTPVTGVPFVVGNANVTLPTSGTFLYSYAGGPSVRDASGGIGSFTGGAFNVSFGSTSGSLSVASPLTISMTSGVNSGASISLGSCSGGCAFTSPSTVAGNMVLSGTCTNGSCSTGANVAANAAGIFVGPQGAGLAVAGNINTTSGPSIPTTTFAAGFKR